MSTILEKMKMDMELSGFNPKATKAYQGQVLQFLNHFNKFPEYMGEKEVREYLHHCTTIKHFSESHLNIIYSSLKLLIIYIL